VIGAVQALEARTELAMAGRMADSPSESVRRSIIQAAHARRHAPHAGRAGQALRELERAIAVLEKAFHSASLRCGACRRSPPRRRQLAHAPIARSGQTARLA